MITSEQLLNIASHRTGLNDFGAPDFREPLDILLYSLKEEANLSTVGWSKLVGIMLHKLSTRLLIQEALRKTPEIAKQSISAPLFIVSLPRTGSTLLFNLLAKNPQNRAPELWELEFPTYSLGENDDKVKSKIEAVKKFLEGAHVAVPALKGIHLARAEDPEECTFLFQTCFRSPSYTIYANTPTYTAWHFSHDMTVAYAYYRTQLQILQWHQRHRGKQWIRKSPDHLRWLESLLKIFPDARIVMLHREPREVVASFCSLVLNFRSGYSESVNAKAIGRDALSRLSDNIERMMIARAADPCPSRYYDLQYSDLLRNPVDAVHRLCDYFGLSVSGAFETELRAYATEKPHQKDKFGGHQYSAESFRLDPSHIDSLFQFYRERYISHRVQK